MHRGRAFDVCNNILYTSYISRKQAEVGFTKFSRTGMWALFRDMLNLIFSKICQSSKLKGEIKHLQAFEDNGYPTAVVKKVLHNKYSG